VDDRLVVLKQALADCHQLCPWAWSPAELVDSVDEVHAMMQQIAALELALIAEIDGQGVPVAQGASSTVAWLRDRHRISGGSAKRSVELARSLHRELPVASQALRDGTVNTEQAQVISAAVARVPGEVRAAAEKQLVEEARVFGPQDLGRLGQRIVEVVAPEVAERQAQTELARADERAYDGRQLRVSEVTGTSMVRLTGWLDREGAAHVRAALDPLTAPCPTEEGPDPRRPEQRRADALVEVCRLANACGELPDNGGDRPQVVVTVDFENLRARVAAGMLDDGALVGPATVRRLACDAAIIPAVLDGAGQVLDVGRERRLFTGALRRVLVLRDKGCAFPACDRPARWCDGHHVRHWADGGETRADNGVLLCGHHHRLVHQGDWELRIVAGFPEFIPPEFIDPERKPRRNRYHPRE
jgi:hypothetical protein